MKAHGLALTQVFCRVFGPMEFFVGGFFFNVGFFSSSPHGPGPKPVSWAKLTPLIKIRGYSGLKK